MKLYIAMSAEQDERAISHLAAAAILRHLESYDHASIQRSDKNPRIATAEYQVRHNFLSTHIELHVYPDPTRCTYNFCFRLSGETRDETTPPPAEGSIPEAFDEYENSFRSQCVELRRTVTEDTTLQAQRLVQLAEEIDRTDTLTRLVAQAQQDLSTTK